MRAIDLHEHEYDQVRAAGHRYEQLRCLGCGRVWFSDSMNGELEPWNAEHEALFARIESHMAYVQDIAALSGGARVA